MLIRTVRMTFSPAFVDQFLLVFEANCKKIRSFDGCFHLELWKDQRFDNVFFTFSHWASADHLEAYRKSDLFKAVWNETKKGFADKPQAWSTNKILEVKPF